MPETTVKVHVLAVRRFGRADTTRHNGSIRRTMPNYPQIVTAKRSAWQSISFMEVLSLDAGGGLPSGR